MQCPATESPSETRHIAAPEHVTNASQAAGESVLSEGLSLGMRSIRDHRLRGAELCEMWLCRFTLGVSEVSMLSPAATCRLRLRTGIGKKRKASS
jgi:hypothetical protein